jgi:hypothetical protein
MTLPELQAKLVAFTGKIESAQVRVEECRQALADDYLDDEQNIPRLRADVMAAEADLTALSTARETMTTKVREAEETALQDELVRRGKQVDRHSKAYKVGLQKVEEYLQLMLTELENADKSLGKIRKLSSLPDIGDAPVGWSNLTLALREPTGPIAISMAGIIGLSNPRLAEDLGRALSNHKTAAVQAKGRSISEMGIDAGGIIAA